MLLKLEKYEILLKRYRTGFDFKEKYVLSIINKRFEQLHELFINKVSHLLFVMARCSITSSISMINSKASPLSLKIQFSYLPSHPIYFSSGTYIQMFVVFGF